MRKRQCLVPCLCPLCKGAPVSRHVRRKHSSFIIGSSPTSSCPEVPQPTLNLPQESSDQQEGEVCDKEGGWGDRITTIIIHLFKNKNVILLKTILC